MRILLDNRQLWLPCTQPYLIPGLPLPCVDGMWLVVVVRLWPSVLVSFVNLAVAYQVSACLIWHFSTVAQEMAKGITRQTAFGLRPSVLVSFANLAVAYQVGAQYSS